MPLNHKFKAMGGEFRLMCFPQNFHSEVDVQKIFSLAEREVNRIEEKFTDFKDSPFNEINRYAGIRAVEVDGEIFDLIKKSIEVSIDSDGIFDISYASLGHLWREARSKGRVLTQLEKIEATKFIDFKKIQLNEKEKTVFLPFKKMKIGLGGIGKGYAVDKVFELLSLKGLYNFYVNGAGDIRVNSHLEAPRPWKIGIRNPLSNDPGKSMGVIQLKEGSVSSSGGYIQNNKNITGKMDHHILDPKLGESAQDLISSTVFGEDAILSDTAATILMNLSATKAVKYLNKRKLFGFVVDKSGKSHLSDKAINSFGL